MRIFGVNIGGEDDPEAERRRAELAARIEAVRAAEQRRQQYDLAELARGGIPIQAQERLREIGGAQGEGLSFTSNLSPEEAGLLRREGYRPLGLVTGSAMYHVGQAYASKYNDCEVDVLSSAYDNATQLAVNRLQQELHLIGAHGVVGVRLELVRHEWGDKTVEVQVFGTAIAGPGSPPRSPWLCDLSGQEWWALHRAGYEPTALLWGYCAWFILTTYDDEMVKQTWSNREMSHWSDALSHARHRAMYGLMQRARQSGATGVAGVRFDRRLDEIRLTGPDQDPVYEREHHNLVVSIAGTGIRLRPNAPKGVTPTVSVLSLLDGRLSTAGLGAADARII